MRSTSRSAYVGTLVAQRHAERFEAEAQAAAEAGDFETACALLEQATAQTNMATAAHKLALSIEVDAIRTRARREHRPAPGAGPRVIALARERSRTRARRRERRPGTARRRSSARSGDSGPDDSDPPPPTVEPWRWASPESWRSFVESIESHDVERQIKRERES